MRSRMVFGTGSSSSGLTCKILPNQAASASFSPSMLFTNISRSSITQGTASYSFSSIGLQRVFSSSFWSSTPNLAMLKEGRSTPKLGNRMSRPGSKDLLPCRIWCSTLPWLMYLLILRRMHFALPPYTSATFLEISYLTMSGACCFLLDGLRLP
jgi:hypothetical protein